MAGNYNDPNNMSLDDLVENIVFSDSDKFDIMSSSDWIKDFLFDDSDERQLELILQLHGESSSSRSRRRIDRDREAGHERLFRDYFAPNPVYPPDTFRRRFQMGRHVFLRIVEALSKVDPYFQQRVDAIGKKGFIPTAKMQSCHVCVSVRSIS